MEVTVLMALAAGVVSFASPCFLPIVPAFVGQLVGHGDEHLPRAAALRNAVSFVAGFSAVFIALWASIGLLGQSFGPYLGWFRILGGAVLVFMGLHLAGILNIPVLNTVVRARMPTGATATNRTSGGTAAAAGTATAARTASPARAALMGVVFGAGWTPCIGPILGGILALATMSTTAWSGIALMVSYCLGLGVPIIVVALGSAQVVNRFDWFRRHHVAISLVSGALLVVIGFLMITDMFAKLAGLIPQFGI